MQKRMINSIDDLVDAYGGPSALGNLLNITQEAVSLWKIRGSVPAGWHLRLDRDAKARGWEITDAVWGYSTMPLSASAPTEKASIAVA